MEPSAAVQFEFAAVKEARIFLIQGLLSIREYDLSNSKAATLGMVCSGRVKVLFESFESRLIALMSAGRMCNVRGFDLTENSGWLLG